MADFGDRFRGFLTEIPLAGGMFGSFFGDPREEELQRQMALAQQRIDSSRQMSGRMRPATLEAALGAFNPANQMIQQMYGPQFGMDFSSIAAGSAGPMQPVFQDPATAALMPPPMKGGQFGGGRG